MNVYVLFFCKHAISFSRAGLQNISSERVEARLYDKCEELHKRPVGSTGFVIVPFPQDLGSFRTRADLRGSDSGMSGGVSDIH